MNASPSLPLKEKQRLFIAVPLPDRLKQTLSAWSSELRASLPFRKWTDEADLHVTLQFLGDTDLSRIPKLKAALTSAVSSGKLQPFDLTLQGMGTFGRPAQPKVLWAGIGGALEQLHSLQRIIVETTAPLGFQAEERPYSPHLTIARNFTSTEGFSQPELHGDVPLEWQVNEIVLYCTHMNQQPMYEAAARFALC